MTESQFADVARYSNEQLVPELTAEFWKSRAGYWYKQAVSVLADGKETRAQAQTMAAALERIAGRAGIQLLHGEPYCDYCHNPWPRTLTNWSRECVVCIARAAVGSGEVTHGQ